MTEVTIKIDGLERARQLFIKSPTITKKWLNQAIKASIFEIRKVSADERVFQFKTPASLRTRRLALSFSDGIKFGDLRGEIGPTVDYAKYVHEGTSPHIIRARNKKVLANRRTGQVFGKVVRHPGTPANPFMQRIANKADSDIQRHFKTAINKASDEIANKIERG